MLGGRANTIFVVVLVTVVALAIIVFLTPVYSWITGPAAVPSSTVPAEPIQPVTEEPAAPVDSTLAKSVSFSEAELQELVTRFLEANSSSKFDVESVTVKLDGDRMLISARGKALGVTGETTDMEVTCEGRTVTAAGVIKIKNLEPKLGLVFDINTVSGKPEVEVKEFRLPLLVRMMLNLSKEKVSSMINSNIEARNWKLPYDLDSISIRDGRLFIEYK